MGIATSDYEMRQLRDRTPSFLMKLRYNIVADINALWVRVLDSKYGMKEHAGRGVGVRSFGGLVWSGLRENIIRSMGDGNSIITFLLLLI